MIDDSAQLFAEMKERGYLSPESDGYGAYQMTPKGVEMCAGLLTAYRGVLKEPGEQVICDVILVGLGDRLRRIDQAAAATEATAG